MGLTYQSIRGGEKEVTTSMATLQGLIKDDGLFMPSDIPELDMSPERLASMTYQEIAYEVMELFLTDYTEAELKDCIAKAYDSKSDAEEIAPPVKADGVYYLGLYCGSTIALKDMALSTLSYLITTAVRKSHMDRKVVILTATSGDTDKTTIAGFADMPSARIIIFYPKNEVSKVQELQMRIQKRDNTSVVTVRGSFDDTQTGVRKVFGDKYLEAGLTGRGFRFSSANSINVGRPVPQIIRYIHAYAKLSEAGKIDKGEKINVVVPTGNLGDILTAHFAKRMGPPVKTLIYVSNDNEVSCDFFTTGIYNRGEEFALTSSQSMNTLIFSNLECLIYLSTGCDAQANATLMRRLSEEGRYKMTPEVRTFMSDSAGSFVVREQDAATIRRPPDDTGCPISTHTGVAAAVYTNYRGESRDSTKTVIASTANPYKFSHSIMEAITGREGLESRDEFEIVDVLSTLSGVTTPQAVKGVRHVTVRHSRECGVDDMENEVEDTLGIS